MNTILERVEKIKGYVVLSNWRKTALFSVILGISSGSFLLGYISGANTEATMIQYYELPDASNRPINGSTSLEAGTEDKLFVASRNGTRYYLPYCQGVSRIKEENKVWFSTKEEAESKGYTPAKNCPGL